MYRAEARRAISAMRDPTFEPEKISSHQGMSRIDWWRAMIDEALNLSMRTFAFVSRQGGCGKSTLAACLAAAARGLEDVFTLGDAGKNRLNLDEGELRLVGKKA